MEIHRYKIVPDTVSGFCVVDRLMDDYVCIPLTCDSVEALEEIMGKDMEEMVSTSKVHPGYLKKESKL